MSEAWIWKIKIKPKNEKIQENSAPHPPTMRFVTGAKGLTRFWADDPPPAYDLPPKHLVSIPFTTTSTVQGCQMLLTKVKTCSMDGYVHRSTSDWHGNAVTALQFANPLWHLQFLSNEPGRVAKDESGTMLKAWLFSFLPLIWFNNPFVQRWTLLESINFHRLVMTTIRKEEGSWSTGILVDDKESRFSRKDTSKLFITFSWDVKIILNFGATRSYVRNRYTSPLSQWLKPHTLLFDSVLMPIIVSLPAPTSRRNSKSSTLMASHVPCFAVRGAWLDSFPLWTPLRDRTPKDGLVVASFSRFSLFSRRDQPCRFF